MRVRHDRGVPVQRYDRVSPGDVELPPKREAAGGAWDVAAVFSRDGVQEYEGEHGQLLREARPWSEVAKSAPLMRGLLVTLQHPGDGQDPDQGAGEVTPQNARDLFHGHVLSADAPWPAPRLVGGWVRLATAEIQGATGLGTREVSVGYTAVLRDPRDPDVAHLVAELGPEPGVMHDGTRYDLIQTQITPNHLAVVDRARAGPIARLRVDGAAMKKTIKIDGKTYQAPVLLADAAKATALDTAAQTKARADALEVGEITIEGQVLTLPKSTIDQILAMLGAGGGPSVPEPMDAADVPPAEPAPPRLDMGEKDPTKMADALLDQRIAASLARVLPQALAPAQARVADAVTRQVRDRSELDRRAATVLGDGFSYRAHDDHGVAVAVLDACKHPRLEQAKALAEQARKGDSYAAGSLRTLMDLAIDQERDRRDSSGDLLTAGFSVALQTATTDAAPPVQPWRKRQAELLDSARGIKPKTPAN